MNILTVVFTLLMMLSILTYGRLQTFLHFSAIEGEYHKMIKSQRNPYNEVQKDLYEELTGIQRKEDKKNTPPKPDKGAEDNTTKEDDDKEDKKSNLCSQFYLGSLIRKTERTDDQKYNQKREFLKRLIEFLYGNHEFYKEMLIKRPDFVDQLLNSVTEVSEKDEIRFSQIKNTDNKKKARYQKKEDLSTMELDDFELQQAYYKMLKGSRKKKYVEKEYLVKDGYISLLEFITIDNKSKNKKLSVYLAPGELLKVLYMDDSTVQQIIEAREEISLEMKRSDPLNAEEGRKRLENIAKGKSYLGPEEDSMLDFSVSTSNAKAYR